MESSRDRKDRKAAARLRDMVRSHYSVVWRVLRRCGVEESEAEDAAQQVFMVASRRLADIRAGRERAFVTATAVRVASETRRAARRRRTEPRAEVHDVHDPSPGPDELAERSRARRQLDELLAAMPEDTRTVFVLFELEEMTMREIAEIVDVPTGTVASRLRRGREWFRAAVATLREPDEASREAEGGE